MKLAYRSILTTKLNLSNRKRLEDAVNSWFLEKKGFSFISAKLEEGHLSGWEMVEPWVEDQTSEELINDPDLNARTQILIFPHKGLLYLWIDIYSPSAQIRNNQKVDRQVYSATPRLISNLLKDSSMVFMDAGYPIRSESITITSLNELLKLKTYLENPLRRLSVYLACPPSVPDEDWRNRFSEITKFSQGLAISIELSPSMRSDFHAFSGKTHSIPNGGIRTFVPEVIFDDYYDGYRHKLLTMEGLITRKAEYLRRSLREALVRRATTNHLDESISEIKEKFEASLKQELRKKFTQIKSGGQEPYSQRENELAQAAKDWEKEAEDLDRELGEAKREIKRLNIEAEDFADVEVQNWALAQQVENLKEANLKLQRRLAQSSKSPLELLEEEESPISQLPVTFEELIERLPELEHLDYRGDAKKTLELQSKALATKSANEAWKILKSLQSYAEMKSSRMFEGSFRDFVKNNPSGVYCEVKPGQLNTNESETVLNNPNLRKQRQISVPAEVDERESVICTEHIDLNNTRRAGSARIYFYDATKINGNVYIGPISEHLDNGSTN